MAVLVGIAFGGALGALARYGVDEWLERVGVLFPWGIFVVNISGCFAIGVAVEVMEPRFEDVSWFRLMVVTGFLGAYTTFSTFSLDTYRLLQAGDYGTAFLSAAGSVVVGLLAVWLGLKVGRAL